MGCFIVPATEAIVTTVATKVIKNHENKELAHIECADSEMVKIPFSTKLGWLNKLLCGGSVLLAFEHVWHGEVIPTFPFLTAVQNGETSEMLAEMGSAGVMMAVLATSVWVGMLVVTGMMEKRAASEPELKGEIA